MFVFQNYKQNVRAQADFLSRLEDITSSPQSTLKLADEAYRKSVVISLMRNAAGTHSQTDVDTEFVVQAMLDMVYARGPAGIALLKPAGNSGQSLLQTDSAFVHTVFYCAYLSTTSSPKQHALLVNELSAVQNDVSLKEDNSQYSDRKLMRRAVQQMAADAIEDYAKKDAATRNVSELHDLAKLLGQGTGLYNNDVARLLESSKSIFSANNKDEILAVISILNGIDYTGTTHYQDAALLIKDVYLQPSQNEEVRAAARQALNTKFRYTGIAPIALDSFNDLVAATRWSAGWMIDDLLPPTLQPGTGNNPNAPASTNPNYAQVGEFVRHLSNYLTSHSLSTAPDKKLLLPGPNNTLRPSSEAEYMVYLLSSLRARLNKSFASSDSEARKFNLKLDRMIGEASQSISDQSFIANLPRAGSANGLAKFGGTLIPLPPELYQFQSDLCVNCTPIELEVNEQTRALFNMLYNQDITGRVDPDGNPLPDIIGSYDDEYFKAFIKQILIEMLGASDLCDNLTVLTDAQKVQIGDYLYGRLWPSIEGIADTDPARLAQIFNDLNADGIVDKADAQIAMDMMRNGDWIGWKNSLKVNVDPNGKVSADVNPFAAQLYNELQIVREFINLVPTMVFSLEWQNYKLAPQIAQSHTEFKATEHESLANWMADNSQKMENAPISSFSGSIGGIGLNVTLFNRDIGTETIKLDPDTGGPMTTRTPPVQDSFLPGAFETKFDITLQHNEDPMAAWMQNIFTSSANSKPGERGFFTWAAMPFNNVRITPMLGMSSKSGNFLEDIGLMDKKTTLTQNQGTRAIWGVDATMPELASENDFSFNYRVRYRDYGAYQYGEAGLSANIRLWDIGLGIMPAVRMYNNYAPKGAVYIYGDARNAFGIGDMMKEKYGFSTGLQFGVNISPDFSKNLLNQSYESYVTLSTDQLIKIWGMHMDFTLGLYNNGLLGNIQNSATTLMLVPGIKMSGDAGYLFKF